MAENNQSFYNSEYKASAPSFSNLNSIRNELNERQYPECGGVYEKNKEAFAFYAKNENCILCNEKLQQTGKPIVLLKCQHVYHFDCGHSYLVKEDGRQCPRCTTIDKRGNDLLLGKSKSEDEGFRIDHGTNSVLTAELEKQFGKQGIAMRDEEDDEEEEEEEEDEEDAENGEMYYQSEYGDRTLSFVQKNKLTKGMLNPTKIYKTKIDLDFLLEKNLTLDDLLEAKLDLLDIYFSIGAQTWKDLKDLGMSKKYLLSNEGEFVPLDTLINLYGVDYTQFKADIDFTLKDVIGLDMDAEELKKLDMNFDSLLEEGLTKIKMKKMKENISCSDWVRYLGMNKSHLIRMKMGLKDINELGWNLKKFSVLMKLNDNEQRVFGIYDTLNKDKVNRNTSKVTRHNRATYALNKKAIINTTNKKSKIDDNLLRL